MHDVKPGGSQRCRFICRRRSQREAWLYSVSLDVLISILKSLLMLIRAVKNPKVSKQSKHNALDLLHDELDGDTPRHYLDEGAEQSKDPNGLAGEK